MYHYDMYVKVAYDNFNNKRRYDDVSLATGHCPNGQFATVWDTPIYYWPYSTLLLTASITSRRLHCKQYWHYWTLQVRRSQ